nr:hypothetical protein [Tanacetum cinerariifolium]
GEGGGEMAVVMTAAAAAVVVWQCGDGYGGGVLMGGAQVAVKVTGRWLLAAVGSGDGGCGGGGSGGCASVQNQTGPAKTRLDRDRIGLERQTEDQTEMVRSGPENKDPSAPQPNNKGNDVLDLQEINVVSLKNSFDALMEKDNFFEVNNETLKASNDRESIVYESDTEKVKNVFMILKNLWMTWLMMYGRKDDKIFDDMRQVVEEVEHENAYNTNGLWSSYGYWHFLNGTGRRNETGTRAGERRKRDGFLKEITLRGQLRDQIIVLDQEDLLPYPNKGLESSQLMSLNYLECHEKLEQASRKGYKGRRNETGTRLGERRKRYGFLKEITLRGQLRDQILVLDQEDLLLHRNKGLESSHRISKRFLTKLIPLSVYGKAYASKRGFSYQLESKEVVVLEKNDDNDDGEKEDEEEEMITQERFLSFS